MTVMERAKRVELMLVDIDGVLTDGKIYFVPTASGEWDETKGFSALDGIALQWFHMHGITMGLISGRKSTATEMRAKSGHFKYCYMGNHEKIATLEEIIADAKIPREDHPLGELRERFHARATIAQRRGLDPSADTS